MGGYEDLPKLRVYPFLKKKLKVHCSGLEPLEFGEVVAIYFDMHADLGPIIIEWIMEGDLKLEYTLSVLRSIRTCKHREVRRVYRYCKFHPNEEVKAVCEEALKNR